jgi:hypothetical protein
MGGQDDWARGLKILLHRILFINSIRILAAFGIGTNGKIESNSRRTIFCLALQF